MNIEEIVKNIINTNDIHSQSQIRYITIFFFYLVVYAPVLAPFPK
jgi:hypothetical protein